MGDDRGPRERPVPGRSWSPTRSSGRCWRWASPAPSSKSWPRPSSSPTYASRAPDSNGPPDRAAPLTVDDDAGPGQSFSATASDRICPFPGQVRRLQLVASSASRARVRAREADAVVADRVRSGPQVRGPGLEQRLDLAATAASSPTMAASAGPPARADVEDPSVVRQRAVHLELGGGHRPGLGHVVVDRHRQPGDDARRGPPGVRRGLRGCGVRRAVSMAVALAIHKMVPAACSPATRSSRGPARSPAPAPRPVDQRRRGGVDPELLAVEVARLAAQQRGEDLHVLVGVASRVVVGQAVARPR